jgi:hypothetical protein
MSLPTDHVFPADGYLPSLFKFERQNTWHLQRQLSDRMHHSKKLLHLLDAIELLGPGEGVGSATRDSTLSL